MKLTTLLNFDADSNLKYQVSTILNKIKTKYNVKIDLVNTGFNKFIPLFKEIRLLIFIHPRAYPYSQLKKLIEIFHLNDVRNIVCIIGSSYPSAFPGTFSISRFCEDCFGIIDFYRLNQFPKSSGCNCNLGCVVDIFPSGNADDYFILS